MQIELAIRLIKETNLSNGELILILIKSLGFRRPAATDLVTQLR